MIMGISYKTYKEKYHFSLNLYSIFLIVTFIPDIVGINNSIIKYLFWVVRLSLALWIIYKDYRSAFRLSLFEFLFVILALIYTTNLFIDVFLDPIPALKNSGFTDFIGFFIGIILALSFRYDSAFHSETSFKFFWVTLTFGLIVAYFLAIENTHLDVSNVRYDANSTINTIMYGQTGCALSLISLFGFIHYKKATLKILFALTFVVGLLSIAKAGSRSPVVVLALVSIFYMIARLGKVKGLLILSVFVGLVLINIKAIIGLLSSMGSSLAVRLTSMIQDKETSGRDVIYANALSIIEESPIFGSYYLIPSGIGAGGYPHNYFLEVFMTTGALGGVIFLALVIYSLFKSYNLIRAQHFSSWIVILYLQILVYGMFSTGLYTSQDFWILLFYTGSLKVSSSLSTNTLPQNNRLPGRMRVLAK
ncbi:O-antigen ligase family protein [Tunicatimonas pelagia]|uniref:O-antigen ligase family protein n=1 Tax=Tunicatimonas pelagia TaxID=931531 RepID=UPI002666EAB0|nr:O-antigen ligase family protein [Tunicatimonas pelagia]WKN40440.1 O-antigen ligase family protein [Tunicatimonas pelagia]